MCRLTRSSDWPIASPRKYLGARHKRTSHYVACSIIAHIRMHPWIVEYFVAKPNDGSDVDCLGLTTMLSPISGSQAQSPIYELCIAIASGARKVHTRF